MLIVFSGPSGSGKTSLCQKFVDHFDNCHLSISTTTRAIRSGEIDGKDYHFVSKAFFEQEIAANNFIEYAQVHGNYYGTSKKTVEQAQAAGQTVVFDIDVKGHENLRKIYKQDLYSIFVLTKSLGILKQRLESRATDSEAVIEKRLTNALGELDYIKQYDYLLFNDDFDLAFNHMLDWYQLLRIKSGAIKDFIDDWQS